MVEAIFPPSSNWSFSKIISTREDGSVAYGSQNDIFVMKVDRDHASPLIIIDAHKEKVTSVAFCPTDKNEDAQNLLLSSSEDGFVKIWNIVYSQKPVIGHNSHSAPKDVVKVVCASWSPCNSQYVVSAAENDTLVLWNTLNNTTTRFLFPKLKPSVIECSYHDERILGVGSKSGMVFIVKLVGKGEIIHSLRGHDKEVQALSWSPIPDVNEGETISQKCLLASSCQEKEIFIWNAEDGDCVNKLHIPKASVEGENQYGKWDPSVAFIPLFWATPNHLYSSSKCGGLICCDPSRVIQPENKDPTKKNKKKGTSSCWKLVHDVHTNAILAIAGLPVKTKNENGNAVGNGLSKDFSDLEINSEKLSIEYHIRCLNRNRFNSSGIGNPEPETFPKKGLIWTLGKDQRLVAIGKNIKADPEFCFHTVNGHPFAIEVLPIDPNVVAIGAGDGKIRRWNVTCASGEAHVFGQKINDRVYSLAWHPYKESVLAFGTSEGRVGIIDVYSQKPPTNLRTRHGGKVYRLSWGPTITEEGISCSSDKKDLCLYSVGGHKLLWHHPKTHNSETLKIVSNIPCKKFVDLSWKSDLTVLAVGSRKGYIYLVKPPKFEVVCSVLATAKCVMSLTWHPSSTTIGDDCPQFCGYMTFASVDNENVIKVYNCTEVNDSHKMEQVSILKGHSGYIQFVSWNPHISGRLISSSADFSIRIWDVTTSTQLVKLHASHSILPLFCIWSPVDPEIVIAGFSERMVISWRISESSKLGPVLKVRKLEKGNSIQHSEPVNNSEVFPGENNKGFEESSQSLRSDKNKLTLAKRNEDQKSVKEEKMFVKTWNPDIDSFQSCYELLKAHETESVPNYKLSFLKSSSDFFDHLKAEDESFKAANNWGLRYQLGIWRGNLNVILEEHIKTGNLDDFLVSLATFVSPPMWREACAAYSKTLAEKKQYRKAATYLLAIHKIYEAIDLLVQGNMYLEAICVARCRLPDSEPILPDLVRKYADWLTDTGNVLRASECFMYLNDFSEAVMVLARKNQPEHLSLAALASKRAGLDNLEREYSYRALVLCLETEKLELASRISSDHSNIKKLRVLYETYQLLLKLDSGELTLEKDFIAHLKELNGIDSDPNLYASLQYIYDRNTIYLSKKNMYVVLAHEFSLACCATEKDILLSHIIKAIHTASRLVQKEKCEIPMVYKLISWLSPGGVASYLNPDSIFGSDDENINPKIISLRAFLCLGIVELIRNVLDQNINSNDMDGYTSMLDKLLNDALDKETFAYFKNQVEIKLIEKRINEAYKRKNEQKDNHDFVKEEPSENNETECPETCTKDALEPENVNEVSEDDIIAFESKKMNTMIADIKKFEESRISAPNPAVIYCTLREVLEACKEEEILNKVEKMFQELKME